MPSASPQAQSAVQGALAADALAAADDAVITIDASVKVTSWNAAAEPLLGFSHADAAEHGLAIVIPAEDPAWHVAASHVAMESGRLAHAGAVARTEAVGPSGARLAFGFSPGLIAGTNGRPQDAVAVLRRLTPPGVEFVPASGNEQGKAQTDA